MSPSRAGSVAFAFVAAAVTVASVFSAPARAVGPGTNWFVLYQGSGFAQPRFLAVSTDGSTVFVTGADGVGSATDVVTVAYDAHTGSQLWTARFNDQYHQSDLPGGLTVSPDGTKVIVTLVA